MVDLLRAAKKKYLQMAANKKKIWRLIKFKSHNQSQIPNLIDNGITVSTMSEKATLLNNVLAKNFNRNVPALTEVDLLKYKISDNMDPPQSIILCSEEDIFELLQGLDVEKATGLDGISGRMLKGVACAITPPLTKLFNRSITSGVLPAKWKTSSVVPIPKTKPASDNPIHYRPISLLAITSKLLERHIYDIVLDHLIETDGIPSNQWGFVPGRSTVSALLTAFEDMSLLMENGYDIVLIFFDLRKALDSVPHGLLLYKLKGLQTTCMRESSMLLLVVSLLIR